MPSKNDKAFWGPTKGTGAKWSLRRKSPATSLSTFLYPRIDSNFGYCRLTTARADVRCSHDWTVADVVGVVWIDDSSSPSCCCSLEKEVVVVGRKMGLKATISHHTFCTLRFSRSCELIWWWRNNAITDRTSSPGFTRLVASFQATKSHLYLVRQAPPPFDPLILFADNMISHRCGKQILSTAPRNSSLQPRFLRLQRNFFLKNIAQVTTYKKKKK